MDQFDVIFEKRLREAIASQLYGSTEQRGLLDQIASGQAPDYASYRQLTGEVKGLYWVLEAMKHLHNEIVGAPEGAGEQLN